MDFHGYHKSNVVFGPLFWFSVKPISSLSAHVMCWCEKRNSLEFGYFLLSFTKIAPDILKIYIKNRFLFTMTTFPMKKPNSWNKKYPKNIFCELISKKHSKASPSASCIRMINSELQINSILYAKIRIDNKNKFKKNKEKNCTILMLYFHF